MSTQIFIFITLLINVEASLNCTPAIFNNPATLKSKEKVCNRATTLSLAAQAESITGAFDPSTIPTVNTIRPPIFETLLTGAIPPTEELISYVQGLISFILPAVIFLCLNLCCCCCCTCCHSICKCTSSFRTCHCHWCKCTPNAKRPYTKCESTTPMIAWIFISLLMITCGIAGIVQGVYKLNDSIVNTVCVVDDVYLRFNAFLVNVKTPLDQLNVDFALSVKDLKEAAVQDPQLSENVRNIGAAFSHVKLFANRNKASVQTDSIYKDTCDQVWDNLVTQCNEAKIGIMADSEKIDNALIDVQTQIQTSVVDASASAIEALEAGSTSIGDTQTQVESMLNPRSYNLINLVNQIRNNRDTASLFLFGFVGIYILMGLLGIVGMCMCRKHRFLENGYKRNREMQGDVIQLSKCWGQSCACLSCCSWFCVLLFGILSALIALLLLPISTIGSDVCTVLPTLPSKMGATLGDQVSQITNTCWNQTGNLFYGLKLNENINIDGINFDNFKKEFSDNGVDIDEEKVKQLYETIEGINLNCYNNIKPYMNETLKSVDWISNNITFAEEAFNTNPSADLLSASGEVLVGNVKCAIKDFVKSTGCYFIKTTWDDAVNVLCNDMIGSLAWIGTAHLFLAVLAIPYAITLMCLMKRIGGHGPVKAKGSNNDEVELIDIDNDGKISRNKYRRRGDDFSDDEEEEEEEENYEESSRYNPSWDNEQEEEEELGVDEILNWKTKAKGKNEMI